MREIYKPSLNRHSFREVIILRRGVGVLKASIWGKWGRGIKREDKREKYAKRKVNRKRERKQVKYMQNRKKTKLEWALRMLNNETLSKEGIY